VAPGTDRRYRCEVPQSALVAQSALRGCVSVTTDLDSLACEWEELAERVDGSPFLRPGWILPWLRAFGTGTPEAITVRRGDELVAVLPMQRKRGRLTSAANWHSPVFGPLVADEEARDTLLEGLFDGGRPSVELSLLHGETDLAAQIESSAREAGRLVMERPITACPVVDLAGCFEDYERRLSRNRRKSLRRGRRALEEQGHVTFEVHEGREGLDSELEDIFRVEGCGWKGKRGSAIASQCATTAFYTDVAHWAASRGWLRLSSLRLDGRTIACDYSIEFQGSWYSLKSGYDEDYRSLGPGALLLREQLRHCFETGASCFELLGTEDAFKLSWTDRSCERMRVHSFDRSPAGLVHWSRATGRESLRPAVHWLRRHLRDQVNKAHNMFASALAAWDSLGLEALQVAA
jgi:CelD/BcsL family acetyltransferase involved in cellulose biosynthesis